MLTLAFIILTISTPLAFVFAAELEIAYWRALAGFSGFMFFAMVSLAYLVQFFS